MKLFFTLVFALTMQSTLATTYYFSLTLGDDNRSINQAKNASTPWKTLTKQNLLSGILKSGDSIVFKKGDVWVGTTLVPNCNGIIFSSYGLGAKPVIDGGMNLAIDVSTGFKLNFTFEGITFRRSLAVDIVAQFGNAWSDLNSGMIHSVIKNCDFLGGVVIQGSYNLFENNLVNGSTNNGNGNGIWEHHKFCHHNIYRGNTITNFSIRGIWTMIDTHDGIFENNIVSNCIFAGIDLDGAYYVVYGHTVRNNTIYDIEKDAIELENAFNCDISGNYMYGGGHSYIYIINYDKCTIKDGYGAAKGTGAILNTTVSGNVMIGGGVDYSSVAIGIHKAGGINIYNNSIYNFKSRFFDLEYESTLEVTMIKLKNNIFSTIQTPSWYGMINFSSNDYNILAEDDYNCFYNNGMTDIYTDRSTYTKKNLQQYKISSGKGGHSISVNPLFMSATDLHLQQASSSLYAGINVGLPFYGPAPNMGAYQNSPYYTLPVSNTTLHVKNQLSAIQLKWITVGEKGISGYELEKSTDGKVFKKRANISARNIRDATSEYSWTDSTPEPGNNYYRLKLISIFGNDETSRIVTAYFAKSADKLSIYPNPVNGNLINCSLHLKKGVYRILLTNIFGQNINSKIINYSGTGAIQTLSIPASTPRGLYLVSVTGISTNISCNTLIL